MTARRKKKLVHEGQYFAEVEVEVIDTDLAWSPFVTGTELPAQVKAGSDAVA